MYLRVFLSLLFIPNFLFASYKYETIADDLDDAWSMVFIDENTILFTELPGNLKIINLLDKSIKNIANTPMRSVNVETYMIGNGSWKSYLNVIIAVHDVTALGNYTEFGTTPSLAKFLFLYLFMFISDSYHYQILT